VRVTRAAGTRSLCERAASPRHPASSQLHALHRAHGPPPVLRPAILAASVRGAVVTWSLGQRANDFLQAGFAAWTAKANERK